MMRNKSSWKMRGRLTGWWLFVKRSLLGSHWKLQTLLQAEKNRGLVPKNKQGDWIQKLNRKSDFFVCFRFKKSFLKLKLFSIILKAQFNLNKSPSSWLHGSYIQEEPKNLTSTAWLERVLWNWICFEKRWQRKNSEIYYHLLFLE